MVIIVVVIMSDRPRNSEDLGIAEIIKVPRETKFLLPSIHVAVQLGRLVFFYSILIFE